MFDLDFGVNNRMKMRDLMRIVEGDVVPFKPKKKEPEPQWTDQGDGWQTKPLTTSDLFDEDTPEEVEEVYIDLAPKNSGEKWAVTVAWHDYARQFLPLEIKRLLRMENGEEFEAVDRDRISRHLNELPRWHVKRVRDHFLIKPSYWSIERNADGSERKVPQYGWKTYKLPLGTLQQGVQMLKARVAEIEARRQAMTEEQSLTGDLDRALALFVKWFDGSERLTIEEIGFLREYALRNRMSADHDGHLYRALRWHDPVSEGDIFALKSDRLSSWTPSLDAAQNYAINYLNDAESVIIVRTLLDHNRAIFTANSVSAWANGISKFNLTPVQREKLQDLYGLLSEYAWQQEIVLDSPEIDVEVVHSGWEGRLLDER